MNTYLFIGGEHDGQHIAVFDERWTWYTRQDYRYQRVQLKGNSKIFEVYVVEGMSGDEIMQKLIDGYSSEAAK